MRRYPELAPIRPNGENAQTISSNLVGQMAYVADQFIDLDTGYCHFNSEEFIYIPPIFGTVTG